jgi:YidC/Oxa1 family membrane protein insertase
MPWFWTIVVGTAFWRIVVLPLTLKGTQNTARVIRHGPALEAAKTRLNAAIKEGNVAYKTAAVQGLSDTYAKARITPSSMVLVPLAQLPIAFGLFLGIKKMCEFPVEQLKYSGIDLLPDLTAITSVADPYYIMPILATVALNIQMMVCSTIRLSLLR